MSTPRKDDPKTPMRDPQHQGGNVKPGDQQNQQGGRERQPGEHNDPNVRKPPGQDDGRQGNQQK